MTGIIKHSDGNLNDIRAYPFADTASRRADNGEVLPEYILNDCNIWWPAEYGSECFLASATLSPNLLTLSFSVVTPNGSITPIGVASINRLENYSSAKILGTIPGVGGWVVVGLLPENINFVKTWHFSDYKNSLILARLAQGYPTYPVVSLSKEGSQEVLFDTVTFLAGTNLQITKGTRVIEGESQDCIIFSLREDLLPELYKIFAGPCGKRPESKTCDATPIKKINGIEPDFDGVLYLDIDNSKGILDGEIIDAGVDTKGIALLTPIDYLDICSEPKFDVLPPDLCASSSISAVTKILSSSSLGVFGVSSSSSSIAPSRYYDFSDPQALGDWSFFEKNNIHAIDWEASPNNWNVPTSPKYMGNYFVVPFEPFGASFSRHLFLNAYKCPLIKENDISGILINFSLNGEDLDQLAAGDKRSVILKFSDSKPLSFAGGRLFEAVLEIQRLDATTIQLATSLKLFNGTNFVTLASGQVKTFTLSCSSSSSAAAIFCNDFSFSVYFEDELITLDTTGTGHDVHHLRLVVNNEVHYSLDVDLSDPSYNDTNREYRNIQFVDIEFQTTGLGSDPQPAVDCIINSITIQARRLEPQICSEPNVDDDLTARVPYKLLYEPAVGWSNDFGTKRAINQFQLLPDSGGIGFQLLTKSGNDLIYQKQYLEKQSGGYKYGILNCESSSINQYIYSLAFKATSSTVKIGLLLGWQNSRDDVFWALVIDPNARQLAYGIHHLPHTFQPNLWVNIPGADTDWPFDWHRLVVKMVFNSGNNTYELNAWLDPGASVDPSGITKTISVDFNNPIYSLTGLTPWDNATFSASMFADGPPGFFAYMGSARIAEYTVSPVDQDIIIPNKVPWLSL